MPVHRDVGPVSTEMLVGLAVFGALTAMMGNFLDSWEKTYYPSAKEVARVSVTDPQWYMISTDELDIDLRSRFIALQEDEGTREFLRNATLTSKRFIRELIHSGLSVALRPFVTPRSIQGLLRRNRRFVFSEEQFGRLLAADVLRDINRGSLLDIEAADGTTTVSMAPYFTDIRVTDSSATMRISLWYFSHASPDHWSSEETRYDVISCLDAGDADSRPSKLLEDMKRILKPGGHVVLGVSLPDGEQTDKRPSFVQKSTTFEEQLSSLVSDWPGSMGYDLVGFSKVPCIREGDLHTPFYHEPCAILILRLR